MNRFVVFLIVVLSAVVAGLPALAQSNGAIQLRLTNKMTGKVDYYLTPLGGKATFAGSVEAGAAIDVQARPGQDYTFAVNRVPFQKYKTRTELFQNLTLAPQGQQKPPVVANAYQKPLSGAKTVEKAPVVAEQEAAPSADGLVWMFSQFEADDGADTAVLVFGLPETDAAQFSASCSASAAEPRVIISADVSRLQNATPVSVRFVASGFDRKIQGKVLHSESGESQEGADMVIDVADPLWQAMSGLSSVNYSVQGQPPVRLPLAGVRQPLGNFLRDCAQFASGGDTASGGGVITDATQLFANNSIEGGGTAADASGSGKNSCAALDGVFSRNGGANVDVTFVNRTDEYRVLLWIDFEGMPVEYAQLEPGKSYQVLTSSTHPWMVTDGPGNCIEKFMPRKGQGEIAMARKSPGFGDE